METPDAHRLISAYTHYGLELPKQLIAPPLHDIEIDLWRAFRELSTDRPRGEMPGPIPWSSIDRYWNRSGLLDRDSFFLVMREMDEAYLSHQYEAAEKAAKKVR